MPEIERILRFVRVMGLISAQNTNFGVGGRRSVLEGGIRSLADWFEDRFARHRNQEATALSGQRFNGDGWHDVWWPVAAPHCG